MYISNVKVSFTIRAENQALNETIDKVMIVLDQNFGHRTFCVKVQFCFEVVDLYLNDTSRGTRLHSCISTNMYTAGYIFSKLI